MLATLMAIHVVVQRYFASGAEMRSQSGPGALIVAPNFRGDWATAETRVPGVDKIRTSVVLRRGSGRASCLEHPTQAQGIAR